MTYFKKDKTSHQLPGQNHELVRFTQRVPQSASFSKTKSDSYEPVEVVHAAGNIDPLKNVRRAQVVPTSGLICEESISLESRVEIGNQHNLAKNTHLLQSGLLGRCDDPYCTSCPTDYNSQVAEQNVLLAFDSTMMDLHGKAKSWVRRFISFLRLHIPPVLNPHAKIVQRWNKFFAISCLFAIFFDPLFFLLLSTLEENKCIMINWQWTKVVVGLRSVTDFIYLLNMSLQFRMAYVAPASKVATGSEELIDQPQRIIRRYLRRGFLIDLYMVTPLPQLMVMVFLPKILGETGANYAKNYIRLSVLIQYIPRLIKFLPLITGQSPTGFIFEKAWSNFTINLLTFMLSGHIMGSVWYLFGLQRVNQCLRHACHASNITQYCSKFIDCGHGEADRFNGYPFLDDWKVNPNATKCFTPNIDYFNYGIYQQAAMISAESNILVRYLYAFFWGFQQITTFAGNQVPSSFFGEVLFTMLITGVGLLLFTLLIGNMQIYLQALGLRKINMTLIRRDVEQWMDSLGVPEELKRRVRESQRYNWVSNRGINAEMIFDSFPEDLRRDMRRYIFRFVKNIRIFSQMDETILNAISERLKKESYVKGSKVLCSGELVKKMTFIVRGKMESIGEHGVRIPLSDGDVCGEELLAWIQKVEDGKRIRNSARLLLGYRTVQCLSNVEAFSIQVEDLEEVITMFSRLLRNPIVQGAIRYESPYWRNLAASRIQLAWRYRKQWYTKAKYTAAAKLIATQSGSESERKKLWSDNDCGNTKPAAYEAIVENVASMRSEFSEMKQQVDSLMPLKEQMATLTSILEQLLRSVGSSSQDPPSASI
ncbi:hypothetical protein ACFE04_001769 [Oxalis oulophora]